LQILPFNLLAYSSGEDFLDNKCRGGNDITLLILRLVYDGKFTFNKGETLSNEYFINSPG
jgi:hypothetical protein